MPNTMTLIASQTLSTTAASITFSSIPQTYTDLKLILSARLSGSSNVGGTIQINGVTSNAQRVIFGTGSAVNSEQNNLTGIHNSNTYTTNTFSNSEIYVSNYTSSNNKNYHYEGTTENNATASYIGMAAGVVNTTSPVTSITTLAAGDTYTANSTFYLYGIVKQ